jgi:hypothetical protein
MAFGLMRHALTVIRHPEVAAKRPSKGAPQDDGLSAFQAQRLQQSLNLAVPK